MNDANPKVSTTPSNCKLTADLSCVLSVSEALENGKISSHESSISPLDLKMDGADQVTITRHLTAEVIKQAKGLTLQQIKDLLFRSQDALLARLQDIQRRTGVGPDTFASYLRENEAAAQDFLEQIVREICQSETKTS